MDKYIDRRLEIQKLVDQNRIENLRRMQPQEGSLVTDRSLDNMILS